MSISVMLSATINIFFCCNIHQVRKSVHSATSLVGASQQITQRQLKQRIVCLGQSTAAAHQVLSNVRSSGIHSSPPLGLGHLLVEISCNVFAAVHVRCYLKKPVWPDFCDCPGILFAGEYQLMVDNPSRRVLQHSNTRKSDLQVAPYR